MTFQEIIKEMERLADPDKVAFKKKKYNIGSSNSLGIYQKDINELASRIGQNKALAEALYNSGIYEAKLLCAKIYPPNELEEPTAQLWVQSFDNWEVCDTFCMVLISRSSFAYALAFEWSKSEQEFIKRAGFTIMACYGFKNKKEENSVFRPFFKAIVAASDDDRNFVKKAVNWALRSVGKRNETLKEEAITICHMLLNKKSKSARWIGSNALKELEDPNVKLNQYPRHLYHKK